MSWNDGSDNGVASPRELLAIENLVGKSPMLYVQLRIGQTTLSALVDSGACDNFISEQAVADMDLEVRPLLKATKMLSANGQ